MQLSISTLTAVKCSVDYAHNYIIRYPGNYVSTSTIVAREGYHTKDVQYVSQ